MSVSFVESRAGSIAAGRKSGSRNESCVSDEVDPQLQESSEGVPDIAKPADKLIDTAKDCI
jgi:hypothetical protein